MGGAQNLGIATGAFVEERDDWDAAVARAVSEGWRILELTAITQDRLDALIPFLDRRLSALDLFERVSIHVPSHFAARDGYHPRRLTSGLRHRGSSRHVPEPGLAGSPWAPLDVRKHG